LSKESSTRAKFSMKKSEPKDTLVREWLHRAQDDELNARAILKDRDGTPSLVCFLSEQIAEKGFKALLLFHTMDYPKTHDLNQLGSLIHPHCPSVMNDLKEEILLLGRYYVGTRYPANIPLESFSWDMAEEAFKAAIQIKEFVAAHLK